MRLHHRAGLAILLFVAGVGLIAQTPAPDNSARDQLHQYIDDLASASISQRTATIAMLRTRRDAERRQIWTM